MPCFISLGKYLRDGIAGSHGKCMLNIPSNSVIEIHELIYHEVHTFEAHNSVDCSTAVQVSNRHHSVFQNILPARAFRKQALTHTYDTLC